MKSLACRLCFVLPIAAFGAFILWIIGGFFSSAFGASIDFYCSIYCKLAVGLVLLAIAVAAFVQVRACQREAKN